MAHETYRFEFVDGTAELVAHGSVRYHELLADGHSPVGSVPESDGVSDALEAWVSGQLGTQVSEAAGYAADAQAAADAAVAPTDTQVATLVPASSGSQTSAALAGAFAPAVTLTGAGIDLTGTTDSTAALQALYADGVARGATRFVGVPGATYKVTMPSGSPVFNVTTDAVTFDMAESSIDNTAYTDTADTVTPIWLVDGAKDFTVRLGDYVGYTLPTPASHHGYRGATLVRAINGADGVRVDARATNLRYGVQSGDYADATKGRCRNFDVKLRGSMIGYPIAAYYADHIRHDIDVDGIHRGVYIAGCNDVRGVLRWRDQYIADVAYLITDCLTGGTDAAAQADPVGAATTSRGCSNVDAVSIDKGSTVATTSTRCAGISLSRVDPCAFRNIRVGVYTVGTNTVSPTVGGWSVVSAAKSIQSRYAYNWEPHVVLDNIEVSGTVDHSGATVAGNTGSEFYVFTYDTTTTHAATVRGFRARDFIFKPSSGNLRPSYFYAPGLATPAVFDGFTSPGVALEFFTNAAVASSLDRCTLDELKDSGVSGGNRVVLGAGTVVAKRHATDSSRMSVAGGATLAGVGAVIRTRETTLTLTGGSMTWANAVPANSVILGVQGRIGAAITGALGFAVGVSGDVGKYHNQNQLTSGYTFGPATATAAGATPHPAQASVGIVVTARSAGGPDGAAPFTGGTLRLVVTYVELPAPTSV